jgi:superoxide dismutase, Fe-Mn family
MTTSRRNFLCLLGAGTTATFFGTVTNSSWANPIGTPVKTPATTTAVGADVFKTTMKFHHDKHHAAYVKNLNAAVAKYPQLKTKTVEELLLSLNTLPKDIQTTVRNNGGGHLNHSMYWQIMGPKGGGAPTGAIATAINSNFGSFDRFKAQFNEAGTKVFGSGWAWLARSKDGKLQIISTPNQDNPITQGLYPIMGNDVWEHAYYLKYQNRRPEYLSAWWNVINWNEVNKRFAKSLKA